MKRGILWSGLGGVATLLWPPAGQGADLLSVYDQALVNDPQIREAEATRLAPARSHARRPSARCCRRSAARPAAAAPGATATRSQFAGARRRPVATRHQRQRSINTPTTWGLNIRQSVFSWANWVDPAHGQPRSGAGRGRLPRALQSLAQRVAQQYFAVLQAQDTVEANEAARDADRAAAASRPSAVSRSASSRSPTCRKPAPSATTPPPRSSPPSARWPAPKSSCAPPSARSPSVLNKPGDDMPLLSPDARLAKTTGCTIAMEQNASLISSRLAADIARDQVRTAFGGHLPTHRPGRRPHLSATAMAAASSRRPDRPMAHRHNASATYGKSLALQFTRAAVQRRRHAVARAREPVPLDRREGTPRAHLAHHRAQRARRLPRRESAKSRACRR